jgi:hypothetical protein
MKTLRWIITFAFVLGLGLPTMTASALPTASMTLTSSMPNPALIGGEITFDLAFFVDGVIPGVAGAEVYLSYNPTLVAPPTTPGSTAAEVLPDFFGVSNFSINERLDAANCPGATSPCIHLVVAGPPQSSQTGIVARFHFRVLAIGSACFSVLQPNIDSTMVDADGYAITFTIASPTYCQTIQSRDTTGVILRQGVPPTSGPGTLACSSVSASGTWPYGPVNTNSAGIFSLPNLPNGTYTFRATYPGYLDSEKTGVVIPNNSLTISVGTTTLRGGDVNNDHVINILDIGSIISRFSLPATGVKSSSPSCGGDDPADINDDGVINISDLAIAAGNWSLVGPTPWP